MADCTLRILPTCEPTELTQATTDTGCPNWSTCLPWGGKLWSEAGCVKLVPGTPPADGVYGKVVIANGCLVGVEPDDPPLYMGRPCAPLPGACGGSSGDTAAIDPSTMPGNLYTLDAVGRPLVRCNIEAGENISVSGDGTLENPYIISAKVEVSAVYARSTNDAIAVTGDGSREEPITVTHKSGYSGQFGQMLFDAYGHCVDVVESASGVSTITGIVPGAGLTGETDRNSGVATLAIETPVNQLNGVYQMGGWDLNVDTLNRIYDIERTINLEPQTVRAGAFELDVNEFGSITGVTAGSLGAGYLFTWPAGQAATRRYGDFTLRFDTALAGVLYTTGTAAFFQGLNIYIDEVLCDLTPFGLRLANPTDLSANGPHGIAFWANGVFGTGSHTLSIQAAAPWLETVGAQVILNAVSLPDSVYEDV